MNKSEETELERMTGVDPYEDEIGDGVPMWLAAIILAILMMFTWIGDDGKPSTGAVRG